MGARGLALAVMAAAAFTSGGLLMKPAHGMTRVTPTIAVLALFLLGAVLNAVVVMLSGEVGPPYVLVLGIETVLAFGLGVVLLGEQASALRLGAVGLVLIGSILLAVDTYEPSPPAGRESPPLSGRSSSYVTTARSSSVKVRTPGTAASSSSRSHSS